MEVTFTEPVTTKILEKYGTIKEHQPTRVVLEVPKAKAKQMAADILTKLPVDDILINEVEIDDVIRHIFQLQKK